LQANVYGNTQLYIYKKKKIDDVDNYLVVRGR